MHNRELGNRFRTSVQLNYCRVAHYLLYDATELCTTLACLSVAAVVTVVCVHHRGKLSHALP